MSLVATLKQRVRSARERWPLLDHLVRAVEHYGGVNGSALAAAVTYFAFLSFFPILALAFFAVGVLSRVVEGADEALRAAITSLFPGIIGDGENELQLRDFRNFSGLAGLIGLAGLLGLKRRDDVRDRDPSRNDAGRAANARV